MPAPMMIIFMAKVNVKEVVCNTTKQEENGRISQVIEFGKRKGEQLGNAFLGNAHQHPSHLLILIQNRAL
jgi:hypothetical protein